MGIQIFGRAKCFDTKKAELFFKERRVPVQRVDLDRYGISRRELAAVRAAVGDWESLLNPRAEEATVIRYLAHDDDKEEKLLANPQALRTPIVRCGRQATVGYCPEVWKRWLET